MLFVKIKPANTWAAINLQNKDIPSQPSKPRENKLFRIKYAQYFIQLRIKYAYYSFRIKYVRYVSFNYVESSILYLARYHQFQVVGNNGHYVYEVERVLTELLLTGTHEQSAKREG